MDCIQGENRLLVGFGRTVQEFQQISQIQQAKFQNFGNLFEEDGKDGVNRNAGLPVLVWERTKEAMPSP